MLNDGIDPKDPFSNPWLAKRFLRNKTKRNSRGPRSNEVKSEAPKTRSLHLSTSTEVSKESQLEPKKLNPQTRQNFIKALDKLKEDPDGMVRFRTARALSRIGDKDGTIATLASLGEDFIVGNRYNVKFLPDSRLSSTFMKKLKTSCDPGSWEAGDSKGYSRSDLVEMAEILINLGEAEDRTQARVLLAKWQEKMENKGIYENNYNVAVFEARDAANLYIKLAGKNDIEAAKSIANKISNSSKLSVGNGDALMNKASAIKIYLKLGDKLAAKSIADEIIQLYLNSGTARFDSVVEFALKLHEIGFQKEAITALKEAAQKTSEFMDISLSPDKHKDLIARSDYRWTYEVDTNLDEIAIVASGLIQLGEKQEAEALMMKYKNAFDKDLDGLRELKRLNTFRYFTWAINYYNLDRKDLSDVVLTKLEPCIDSSKDYAIRVKIAEFLFELGKDKKATQLFVETANRKSPVARKRLIAEKLNKHGKQAEGLKILNNLDLENSASAVLIANALKDANAPDLASETILKSFDLPAHSSRSWKLDVARDLPGFLAV